MTAREAFADYLACERDVCGAGHAAEGVGLCALESSRLFLLVMVRISLVSKLGDLGECSAEHGLCGCGGEGEDVVC